MPEGQSISLGALDVPVHFVCWQDKLWPELKGAPDFPLPVEVQVARSGGAINSWINQVYHWLRTAGEAVTIGNRTRADVINVVSTWDFGRRGRRNTHYIVAVRADAHEPKLGNFVVYQNSKFRPSPRRAMMKHLPQPGLIPRDVQRKNRLDCLSYMGRARNLLPDLQTDAFRTALSELGVRLDLRFDDAEGRHAWNDYSEVDAVLAVRGRGGYLDSLKPGSKLVNAWHAGVPAILGPETGYQDLQQSELDFMEASTPEDVLVAVKRLKSDPQHYAAMVQNGAKRSADFTAEAIARDWVDLFNTKVAADFRAWQARSHALRWLSVGTGLALEPFSKKAHRRRIQKEQAA